MRVFVPSEYVCACCGRVQLAVSLIVVENIIAFRFADSSITAIPRYAVVYFELIVGVFCQICHRSNSVGKLIGCYVPFVERTDNRPARESNGNLGRSGSTVIYFDQVLICSVGTQLYILTGSSHRLFSGGATHIPIISFAI